MEANNAELLRLLERHHAAWVARDLSSAKDVPYGGTELCMETGDAIERAKGAAQEIRTRVPSWPCPACGQRFPSREAIDAHRKDMKHEARA